MTNLFQRFVSDERGTASIEFVLLFPIFFSFILMTYESGIISIRHVMLEHGVDKAVRAVRIGSMQTPERDALRGLICQEARVLPACMDQLEIELIRLDPLNWNDDAIPDEVSCIDRGEVNQQPVTIDGSDNNLLMLLRACIRIDPFFPSIGIGQAIVQANDNTAADESYALIATGAFVVEPFRAVRN